MVAVMQMLPKSMRLMRLTHSNLLRKMLQSLLRLKQLMRPLALLRPLRSSLLLLLLVVILDMALRIWI